MFKKILAGIASSMIALTAFSANATQAEKSIQLKDGSTVHIFKDGNMGMENRFGRTTDMTPGHVMETKDGNKIAMKGNEVARTHNLLTRQYVGA